MRSPRLRAAFVPLAALLGACSSGDGVADSSSTQAEEPLVRFDAWQAVDRADDPFVAASAVPPACTAPGFRVEDAQSWLELDTTACDWVTLTQPALAAVAEGDLVRIDFSHFDLDADAPTSAELRLRFDDCEAWSFSIAIPGSASVYQEQFRSPCRLTSESQVLFHLHNHGQNTYQLKDLSKLHD